MQRKIHKHPQKSKYWERRHLELYKIYHEFSDKRRFGNISGGPINSYKMLCINCRKGFKMTGVNETCMTCGNKLYQIAQRVRLPRKLASNRIWDKFIKEFCN